VISRAVARKGSVLCLGERRGILSRDQPLATSLNGPEINPLPTMAFSNFIKKKKQRAFGMARAELSKPKACGGPEKWTWLGLPFPRAELNSGRATKSSGRAKNLARTSSLSAAITYLEGKRYVI
jgi:hypothetical protein